MKRKFDNSEDFVTLGKDIDELWSTLTLQKKYALLEDRLEKWTNVSVENVAKYWALLRTLPFDSAPDSLKIVAKKANNYMKNELLR